MSFAAPSDSGMAAQGVPFLVAASVAQAGLLVSRLYTALAIPRAAGRSYQRAFVWISGIALGHAAAALSVISRISRGGQHPGAVCASPLW